VIERFFRALVGRIVSERRNLRARFAF